MLCSRKSTLRLDVASTLLPMYFFKPSSSAPSSPGEALFITALPNFIIEPAPGMLRVSALLER